MSIDQSFICEVKGCGRVVTEGLAVCPAHKRQVRIAAWHPSDPVYACGWCGERCDRPGDGDHRRCEIVGKRLTAERDHLRELLKRAEPYVWEWTIEQYNREGGREDAAIIADWEQLMDDLIKAGFGYA